MDPLVLLAKAFSKTGKSQLENEKTNSMMNLFKKAFLQINTTEIVKSRLQTILYFRFCFFGKFGLIGSYVTLGLIGFLIC